MNNSEYLIEWSKLEDRQLNLNLKKFKDELFWITELFLLIKKLEKSSKDTKIGFRISIGLMYMVFKDIHLSFLSMFRSHFSLSYKNMRSAVEATTFINAIKGNSDKATVWLSKKFLDQNDEKYKKLLKEGRQGAFGKDLKTRFNFISENSHANLFKFQNGRKSELIMEKKTIIDTYSYFDEDEDWFIAHTHYLIETVFLILNVLEEVFRDEIQDKEYKQRLRKKYSDYVFYKKTNLNRILISPKLKEFS